MSISAQISTINVPFHGDALYLVNQSGEPFVPMKPVVEGMGLDWASQFTKIKQRFKSWVAIITMQLPGDNQRREVVCLNLRKLAGWLHTINVGKVRPELREKVSRYQDECDDVLYQYWTKCEVKSSRKKASVEERTPLRDAVNMLVSKKHMMYPEAYSLIHKRFEVRSIEDLTSEQIPVAVEYVHTVILEGELLGNEVGQLKLPFSYPMEYFNQYSHVRGLSERALSAPWRYPADMLIPNGDNPNPLGRMLGELKNMGCEVDAALFQLLSLQHHLESLRSKISSIQRAVM